MLHRASAFPVASLPGWANEAAATFLSNVLDPAFPCIFARQSVASDALYFAFASLDEERRDGWPRLTEAMDRWVEIDTVPDPNHVLVLVLDGAAGTWADEDEALWAFVRHLVAREPVGNEAVGTQAWTPRYGGRPWFFNVNGPANRRSRDAAGRLCFIVQATDSFEDLVPPSQSTTVRAAIRRKIADWDGLPASPLLSTGAANPDGVEWKQFHLPPDNTTPAPPTCPFHAR